MRALIIPGDCLPGGLNVIRYFGLISVFAVASMVTATTSSAQSAGACWSAYNSAVDGCNGSSSCEQQASIDLGICLAALDASIDDCEPGDRC